jgi:superfamily II DNA or RNA helicase
MTAPDLRPDQLDAIASIERTIAAGIRRICLEGATGWGKTVVVAALIAKYIAHGGYVVFIAHRRELIEQTSRKLYDVGVDHGIIQAGYPARPGARVQVASIQTLDVRAFRTDKIELPPADLIIFDEAHHVRAVTYMRVVQAYPNAVILGLTATPCRSDGRGLGTIFQVLVEGPSVTDLTTAGHLV